MQGGIELSARDNVKPHALLLADAAHLLAGEGLARIEHMAVATVGLIHGFHKIPAVLPNLVFIHDINRCAEFFGELHRIEPADCQVTLRIHIQAI